jgi:hypothetical protein
LHGPTTKRVSAYLDIEIGKLAQNFGISSEEKMKMKANFRQLVFLAAVMMIAVSAVSAQTYSGQAYAAGVTVDVLNQPRVTTNITDTGDLPNTGGNISLTSVGTNLPGNIVTVGSSNSSTASGGVNPNFTSQSAASINNLNVGILGAGITADVVSSNTSCNCPGEVRTASSTITNLRINNVLIGVVPNETQTITLNLSGSRVLTVVINERIFLPRSVTANALHITLEDPLGATRTEVIVASARSGINCLIVPQPNLYSGRGTGVRLDQGSLLLPRLSTIISDTGWLPTPGGSITTTTTGAGLSPILSTGVVTSSTEGGIPAATSESSSQVDNLAVDLGIPVLGNVLSLTADVVQSDTQCQCSLAVPTCTGDSDLVGLTVAVLGAEINIPLDFAPNFVLVNINLPLGLGTLRVVVNEQFSAGPGDITVNALRIQLGVVSQLVVDTDLTVAHSHSDIVCGIAPSAATASISGRVLDVFGRPIPRVNVNVTDIEGNTAMARTNNFGYYTVGNLRTGQIYIVQPNAKGFEFEAITVSLSDDVSGIDFIPSSQPSFRKE